MSTKMLDSNPLLLPLVVDRCNFVFMSEWTHHMSEQSLAHTLSLVCAVTMNQAVDPLRVKVEIYAPRRP
mgnify:CR=1 FL=1